MKPDGAQKHNKYPGLSKTHEAPWSDPRPVHKPETCRMPESTQHAHKNNK